MFTILYILELPLLGLYIKEILKSVHKNLCPRLLFSSIHCTREKLKGKMYKIKFHK